MKRFRLLLILTLLILLSCGKAPEERSYFPETGQKAIRQRALDLKSNLKVMSIALEPGYEDLRSLAYFRLGKGARILSCYLTNGEGGESDIQGDYPDYIAATRRMEAGEAMTYLDGEVHFFNFLHIVAARDTSFIREKWPSHRVREMIEELIDEFKPDILMIGRDWAATNLSLREQILRRDVLSVVKRMGPGTEGSSGWKVTRVMAHEHENTGKTLPLDMKCPIFGKPYGQIGFEAAEKYKSLFVQRLGWKQEENAKYSIVYPASARVFNELDSGLPVRNSQRFRWISGEVDKLYREISYVDKSSSLKRLVHVLDSVDLHIYWRSRYHQIDRRALSNWKNGLEQLRCALLGIKVELDVEEDILTMRQVTRIRIKDVKGIEEGGSTSVYFGGLDDDWVINEWNEKKLPFTTEEPYRLLAPSELDLSTPQGKFGLQLNKLNKPLMFFILHQAQTKEKSFSHRSVIKLRFAPKLSVEVLTPILRMVPGEELIVRLINHSRDGVMDTLIVKEEVAESDPGPFRLNRKGAIHIDTLNLTWKGDRKDGSYLLYFEIDGIPVGQFAARKFEADVQSDKRIGYIGGVNNSPLESTLRRLSNKAVEVDIKGNLSRQLQNVDVLIVDRRAFSMKKNIVEQKTALDRFAENGGHIVFMAQDAEVWNSSGLWEDVRLISTQEFDESVPLVTDGTHPFLSLPNRINPDDWNRWLFLRGYHRVQIEDKADFSMPIKTQDGESPLVLTKKIGEGRKTYIALALGPQLLNIHGGVFRLFANIISI